jgi:hypothetical protein
MFASIRLEVWEKLNVQNITPSPPRREKYSAACGLMRPWRNRFEHLPGEIMRTAREVVD